MPANPVFCFLLTFAVIAAVVGLAASDPPRDDTDGPTRSGMRLLTDFGTGCQYLAAPIGGLTARLGPDGRHMGCRR